MGATCAICAVSRERRASGRSEEEEVRYNESLGYNSTNAMRA